MSLAKNPSNDTNVIAANDDAAEVLYDHDIHRAEDQRSRVSKMSSRVSFTIRHTQGGEGAFVPDSSTGRESRPLSASALRASAKPLWVDDKRGWMARNFLMVVGALGVVFGDIGTSVRVFFIMFDVFVFVVSSIANISIGEFRVANLSRYTRSTQFLGTSPFSKAPISRP